MKRHRNNRRRWTERFGLDVLKQRWSNAMPKFFRRMMWVCGLISGTALAANGSMELAHIQPHQWWIDVVPYLVAVPAGAMFACKFTQNYDKNGNPVSNNLPDSHIEKKDTEPIEIEPYDDGDNT